MNIENSRSDCAILVSSCDSYSDLWVPFFHFFNEFWSDCPLPVYLGSESLSYTGPGCGDVKSVHACGGMLDWSSCAIAYLRQIKEPYVLLMLDDFFLRENVRMAAVEYCLQYARKTNAKQLRLAPLPGPRSACDEQYLIGPLDYGVRYRVSTQPAIWDREHLLTMLIPGESIWQFEHAGSGRAAGIDGYFATIRDVVPYRGLLTHHAVEKGRWLPHELLRLRLHRVEVNPRRGVMDLRSYCLYMLASLTNRMLRRVPRVRGLMLPAIKNYARWILGERVERMGGLVK